MPLIDVDTENRLFNLGFDNPNWTSGGAGGAITGWCYLNDTKQGFIVLDSNIVYFTGTSYSCFNSIKVYNGNYYVVSEYSKGNGNCTLWTESGHSYEIPQVPQCSIVLVFNSEADLLWYRELYLCYASEVSGPGSDVRAYDLEVNHHIVEVVGSLYYGPDMRLNTEQLVIDSSIHPGVYGFIAKFSDVGWLSISLLEDTNVIGIYNGHLVKEICKYDSRCLESDKCVDDCSCGVTIWLDDKIIHRKPANVDICSGYVIIRESHSPLTWIYHIDTDNMTRFEHPIKVSRDLGAGRLLMHAADNPNWYFHSESHHIVTIIPEYNWDFFTVIYEQLFPSHKKDRERGVAMHIILRRN